MTKQCSHCLETKALAQFCNSTLRPDGKDYYCKTCRYALNKSAPKRLEYARKSGAKYRANNPEKIRDKSKSEYWRNRDGNLARQKAWAKANPDKVLKSAKRFYWANRDIVLARSAPGKREYYKKHKERLKKYILEWQQKNPDKRQKIRETFYRNHSAKIAIQNRRYCINRTTATPSWANEFFMNEAYDLARKRTKATGYKWVVDHVVPLNHRLVCGLHAHTNLAVVPFIVNARKGNRHWPDMPEMNHGN